MSLKRDLDVLDDTAQGQSSKRARTKNLASTRQLDDNERTSLITKSLAHLVKESLKRDGSTLAISSTGRASKVKQRAYFRKKQKCHFEEKQKTRITNIHSDNDPGVVPAKASFLGIPREIRDLIYSYIYPRNVPPARMRWWSPDPNPPGTATSQKVVRHRLIHPPVECLGRMWWYSQLKKNKCAPLQINRQVRNEMFPVFLKDGYIHSWERSPTMPATIAWLQSLPSEHLELIRAISINLPGDYNPATWLQFDAAVLSRSEKTNITLYYLQGDYHLDGLYRECGHLHREAAAWGEIEDLIDASWEDYELHKHDIRYGLPDDYSDGLSDDYSDEFSDDYLDGFSDDYSDDEDEDEDVNG
jgi:hypothetical protein